jgi:hypothetical protein
MKNACTFDWTEVTRVGKFGYFSWISFNRYSADWEAPHGILLVHQRLERVRGVTADRFAWLMIPLPSNTGNTEVDAVLKDTTIPLDVNGVAGAGW